MLYDASGEDDKDEDGIPTTSSTTVDVMPGEVAKKTSTSTKMMRSSVGVTSSSDYKKDSIIVPHGKTADDGRRKGILTVEGHR